MEAKRKSLQHQPKIPGSVRFESAFRLSSQIVFITLYACLSSAGASSFRSQKDGRAASGCSFHLFVFDEHDAHYTQPLLPKMHYLHPLSVSQLEALRYQAMQIVAMRLSRVEPPLRREVVEYMLDVDSHMWSMRRDKVLGRGAHSCVYRGTLRFGNLIAVKRIAFDDKELDKALQRTSHCLNRHVVLLLGYFIDRLGLFMVYKFISGGSLKYHLHAIVISVVIILLGILFSVRLKRRSLNPSVLIMEVWKTIFMVLLYL